jgi:hypothetical protein
MVSYEVAQQIAGSQRLPVSAQTLRRRLHEHGLLASTDACRQMLLVRRASSEVLHLRQGDLANIPAQKLGWIIEFL